jgi:16S rRNA (guanine1516-N2)-methyltransferase
MNATEHGALTRLLASAHSRASELRIQSNEDGVEIRLLEAQLGFQHSFISGALPVRARQSTQALIKACSNKQRNIKKVLDLTAGWGIDSLTLAWHGQQVMLLEQHELVYAIVAYSLSRLATDKHGAAVADRMLIENIDANSYLQSLDANHEYDCIYLDPMFPRHKSGAKPAKEMQILQALTANLEIDSCFELALQQARRRVVVKRPARAARLSALKPDMVYREKTIRFDVYLTR